MDEDGKDDVLIGDDAGSVYLFTADGERNSLQNRSPIMRMDVGKLGGERLAAVADTSEVQALSIRHQSLPGFRFAPLLTGLLISAVILGSAWFIATMAPKPAERLTLQGQSAESLLANRRMLKESIADVERLKKGGEMTSEAYLLQPQGTPRTAGGKRCRLAKSGCESTGGDHHLPELRRQAAAWRGPLRLLRSGAPIKKFDRLWI